MYAVKTLAGTRNQLACMFIRCAIYTHTHTEVWMHTQIHTCIK